jgi:glutathione S-transferase
VAISLWGRLTSSNVQKVVWALHELGLSYEHVPWGGRFGGNSDPAYLAMNPNGLVPTLRDGDLTLWESHAILRYLAATYGAGSLWPTDASERAIVDQWTDWTATTFNPAWVGVFWQLVRTPEADQNRAAIDKAIAGTVKCFGMMEKRLGEASYLGGERLTYADIAAGVSLYRWTTMPVPALPPAVAAWHSRLGERAAFRQAVNVDYEELRGRLAF